MLIVVGFEVFSPVVMNVIFWDIAPCSPLRGRIVVEVLCYKPEGREFETQ
jgi:hypothetical protein